MFEFQLNELQYILGGGNLNGICFIYAIHVNFLSE